jgi:hypothetical protein
LVTRSTIGPGKSPSRNYERETHSAPLLHSAHQVSVKAEALNL